MKTQKLYVVIRDLTDDMEIVAIYSNPLSAQHKVNMNSDCRIEEHELDPSENETIYVSCIYDPENNQIYGVHCDLAYEDYFEPMMVYFYNRPPMFKFCFCTENVESNMMLQDIRWHGKNSVMLLRAARDEYDDYVFKHGTTKR